MAAEILEAPEAVARQERSLAAPLRALVRRLKAKPPLVVVTSARGSSAHAPAFAKHAIEPFLGIPVAAARLRDRQQGLGLQVKIAVVDRHDAMRCRGDGDSQKPFDGTFGVGGGM